MSYWRYPRVEFSGLKNLMFSSVHQVEDDKIVFVGTDGSEYHMVHDQDCCEHVYVESIAGDLSDLENSPILVAEELSDNSGPLSDYDDSYTWTFYKIATVKGWVDIRWYGSSNGYYSESVELYKVK